MPDMDIEKHIWLLSAAAASTIASLLHIAIIFGGPDWYRFFGAGERMAQLAEQGSRHPTVVTLCIASVLAIFALYAISATGLLPRLPLLKVGLVLISGVFLVRAVAGLTLPWLTTHPAIAQNSMTFWMISSVICLLIGLCFLLGTISIWQNVK
jgi:putative oxidoreductase